MFNYLRFIYFIINIIHIYLSLGSHLFGSVTSANIAQSSAWRGKRKLATKLNIYSDRSCFNVM